MNKLPRDKRIQIISLLVEGMSLRAITRITGVSINTVTKSLIDAGRACDEFQSLAFRNLTCRRIQVDEIWAFCYAKQKNVETAKAAPDGAGDTWTWTAIDADTKLIRYVGTKKEVITGNPDTRAISTSYAERSNLTIRMHTRRFTRLTNAFSKKVENHAHAVALHMMAYNFVRIHGTIKCPPAVAAGVSKRFWDIGEIVTVIEDWEARQESFQKRISN